MKWQRPFRLLLVSLGAVPLAAQIPDNLTITPGYTGLTQANVSITTSGAVTVTGTSTVNYTAGSQITLQPGFHAIAQSATPAFVASIGLPSFYPNSGTGGSRTFTVTATDSGGYQNISYVQIIYNWDATGIDGCQLRYDVANDALHIADVTGNEAAFGSMSLRSPSGTLGDNANSNCQISAAGSGVSFAGNNMVLTLNTTFRAGFIGQQNIYTRTDSASGSGAYQYVGTWTPYPASSTGPNVTPVTAINSDGTVTLQFSDTNGFGYVPYAELVVGASLTDTGACRVRYDRGTGAGNHVLSLYGADFGQGSLIGSAPVGTASILQTSRCILDVGNSSVTSETLNTGVAHLRIAFTNSGTLNTYTQAFDRQNAPSTVASGSISPNIFSLSQISPQSVQQNGQTQVALTINKTGTFASALSFTCSATPNGVSIACPTSVSTLGAGPFSTVLTIAAANTVAQGQATVTITATGGGVTQMETVAVTVTAALVPYPLFSQVSAMSVQTTSGAPVNFILSVAGINGWTSPVTFSTDPYASQGLSVCILQNGSCISGNSLQVPVPGIVTYQLRAYAPGFFNASPYRALPNSSPGPLTAFSINVVTGPVPNSIQLSVPNTVTVPVNGSGVIDIGVITQGTPPGSVTLSSASGTVTFGQTTLTSLAAGTTATFHAGQLAAGSSYNETIFANGVSANVVVRITGPVKLFISTGGASCFLGFCEVDLPNDGTYNTFTWATSNDTPQNLTGCTVSSTATPPVPVSLNILSRSTTDNTFVVGVQASIRSSLFYQNVSCTSSLLGPSDYAPFFWVYDATPVITDISPSWVSPGSNTITITGHNFGTNPIVTIDGTTYSLSNVPLSDSQVLTITFNVTEAAGSNLAVTVTSQGELQSNGELFFVNSQQNSGMSRPISLSRNIAVKNQVTIYLLHGIGQSSFDMTNFRSTLVGVTPPSGLDLTRYRVDANFSFDECAKVQACTISQSGDTCGVDAGARSLARYILLNPPPGDIVLIGYSMGGLIARDLIANNYLGSGLPFSNGSPILISGTTKKIVGLITLGTPNLGYPYDPADEFFNCPLLERDMAGGWEPLFTPPRELPSEPPSTFSQGLVQQWQAVSYSGYWLAAAGTSCTNPFRNVPMLLSTTRGCVSPNGTYTTTAYSDGIICRDSAVYQQFSQFPGFALQPAPTSTWEDPQHIYVHTSTLNGFGAEVFFCSNDPSVNVQLFDPRVGVLLNEIVSTINAH